VSSLSGVISSAGKEAINVSTAWTESCSFLLSADICCELAMVGELFREGDRGKSASLFGDGSRLLDGVFITGILYVL
jgi:hypothetical protein